METALEQVLIGSYKEEMDVFVISHPEAFHELLQLATGNKQPYARRAAWLTWGCMKYDDERVKPFISTILEVVNERVDGHARDLLRILSNMELDEEYEGKVFDLAVNFWTQLHRIPSLRAIAIRLMVKIAKKYPELNNEIILLTEDHFLETLSPGIRHSINRLCKEIL